MMIIGSAQAVNILISLARMKALAILLGPIGIGLMSIYNSLQSSVQQAAGLGIASSGVREIASSRGQEVMLGRVRQVLFLAHLVQGALAMIAVWILRERLAIWLFGDAARALEVGLVGVAILFALLGSAQTALLQGMRRVGDLGRVTVLGSFAGTVAGLIAVWAMGESGLIWFILVQPIATVLIALRYTRRLPSPEVAALSFRKTLKVWAPMAKLGSSFMLGGLASAATLLLVRGRIAQELGLDAAGQFAAAWGITMTYVGFLLTAMGADYYPRLTEVIKDRAAAVRMMNDQAQLGLAIGGPVLILLIGLAPWAITLLYSAEFRPAVTLLQWQSVGNIFKLASWALSFSIIAAARAKTFLATELSFNFVFLTMIFALLPRFGLEIAAHAFVAGYVVYLAIVYVVARRVLDFRWQSLSLALLILHASLGAGVLALAIVEPFVAAIASLFLAAVTALFGLRVVLIKIGPEGSLAVRLARFYAAIGWTIPHPIRPATSAVQTKDLVP
ncbi:O-antigen translocase [Qipengyuania gaetbuli]|uniref:O-antigen translocase n=1 Tax=Qipengyuania gaetbuli TaxID=266952 RepID=UPI001C994AAC|nr:O-antigen translocase [Qipengyuania gaetbuli]MBY6016084.1 O-antigen translocase [Qipengyuania gaetbuli]